MLGLWQRDLKVNKLASLKQETIFFIAVASRKCQHHFATFLSDIGQRSPSATEATKCTDYYTKNEMYQYTGMEVHIDWAHIWINFRIFGPCPQWFTITLPRYHRVFVIKAKVEGSSGCKNWFD